MRIPSFPRLLAPAVKTSLPLVLTIFAMGVAHSASAATDVALSANAAQRATQVSGAAPVLVPPSAMTVLVNETADQALQATDSNGDPLTFSKSFGPGYMTVTTTDPGTGTATGNIHVAPGMGDLGQTEASVSVTDGVLSDQASFTIRVVTPSAAPVLDPVADMIVNAGTTSIQSLHATDSNGDGLTFYLALGPPYATVDTDDSQTGLGSLRIAPSFAVAGSATVTVGVTDGFASDEQSITVTVNRVEVAPVLSQPANVQLRGGEVKDVVLLASDANGDPITFSKVLGPSYMEVTTEDPGQGTAVGKMHFTPAALLNDSMTAVVSASDGEMENEKAFLVFVRSNVPPVLEPLHNVSVRAGSSAIEYLYASDGDGDFIEFTKASGPNYVTVYTFYQQAGYAYGEAHINPTESDVGTATVEIRANDATSFHERSFVITVTPPLVGPILAQPSDMTLTVGEIGEQTVTATDADGSFISISKQSGPAYMTVFTQSSNPGMATGKIQLRPLEGDVGSTTGTVRATDFSISDTKTFAIRVLAGNFPTSCPGGSFTRTTVPVGFYSVSTQTADLDGNGTLDLVLEMLDENRIARAMGNGDGTFGPVTEIDIGNGPYDGVIADLNQDEIPDLAVVNYYSNTGSIYLGDGTGAFGPRRTIAVGLYPLSIAAADLNRDGKMDLVVGNSYLSSVTVLRGAGDGTFAAVANLAAGAYVNHLATADLNGDGAPDIVTANGQDSDISVLLNDGSGVFPQRVDYPVGAYPVAVAAADLNGDGHADLVIGNSNDASVSILLGDGTGSLAPRHDFNTSASPSRIVITDLNGDGHPDIAVSALSGTNVPILLGDGAGAFGPRSNLTAGISTFGIVSGDFNDDLRPDLLAGAAYSGSFVVLLNASCAPDVDHPPVVSAPKKVTAAEGAVLTVNVTATDPDGPALTDLTASLAGLPLGNNAVFTKDALSMLGTLIWTPTFMDARATPYPVTFTATNVLSGAAMTKITVTNTNRAPLARAGGPYTAFMGSPVTFDGRASSDPDGDPLTFSWVFGDGGTGTGAQPAHAYGALGVYGVALTVSDGSMTGLATTTVSVVGMFQARSFTSTGNRNIRLNSGKPQWCIEIEPIAGSFTNEMVDLGSVVMRSTGTGSVELIHAIAGKSAIGGDRDGNGAAEITACFAKEDLRLLFSNLHGTTSATVAFEGRLYTGGMFRATMDVGIIAGGGGNLAASISPNPLNPSAILTYFTTQEGPVSLQLFNPQGRLVRTMLRESHVDPGYHDVSIDGRDDRGVPLASGVYYFRLRAAEETTTGRFTVLR
ncbi:MAG TPA: FG-GAP-like repeat-containing protein [Candidatus Eisenbacteria bacterium]|nr:FG-GAP-like repeat-containing protein [Candidatus Eisenbacteria bacterium]